MSKRHSTRDISGMARPGTPDELQFVDLSELSRYDILLAAIPLALLFGWAFGQVSSVPVWAAMAAAALATLPLVADGLAVNPPQ